MLSGKEDPIQRALSGFSLYTLGDEQRQGSSIAVLGKELERYEVGPATVVIANDGGIGRYAAVEPALTERERERLSRLLDHLFMSISPEDATDPSKRLIPNMVEAARSLGFLDEVTRSLQKYEYYVKRELKGYGRLDVLMNDFNIEDIKCTGHGRPVVVLHKNHSELGWIRTNVVFPTEEDAEESTQKMLQRCGTMATNAMPIVDARTPTNDRIAVRWSTDVSMTGTAFTVRKFPAEPMPITTLVELNTVSPLMVAYLWLMLEARGFLMVVGPTSAGKTTFMNTLASLINPNSAVCTIEDNPEIRLSHEVWDQLTSRHSYSIGQTRLEITLQDLVKHSLRLTPDFVIVGEVRGETVFSSTRVVIGMGSAGNFLTVKAVPVIETSVDHLTAILSLVGVLASTIGMALVAMVPHLWSIFWVDSWASSSVGKTTLVLIHPSSLWFLWSTTTGFPWPVHLMSSMLKSFIRTSSLPYPFSSLFT